MHVFGFKHKLCSKEGYLKDPTVQKKHIDFITFFFRNWIHPDLWNLVHPPPRVFFCCWSPLPHPFFPTKTPAQIPKLHVVDLCCGSGLTSFTLTVATKTVERITAVDRRPEQVMPHFKEVLLDFTCFCWGGGASKREVGGKDDFLQIVEFSLIMLFGLAI